MNFDNTKHELVKKAALVLFLIVLISTIVKPFFADQPQSFLFMGLAYSILSGALYVLIVRGTPKPIYAFLVIALGFAFLVPIMIISGGIASQFAYIVPIIPVVVGFLSSQTATKFCICLSLVLIMSLHLFEDSLPVFNGITVSEDLAHVHTLWLCLSTLLGGFFGLEFEKLTRRLGLKLQQINAVELSDYEANKNSITEYLDDIIESKEDNKAWISALIISIDKFKLLSKHYDDQLSRLCVNLLAKNIKSSIRQHLDVFSRFDESSYILVLRGVDQSNTHKIAEKIRQSIEASPIGYQKDSVMLTVSAGYCSQLDTQSIDADNIIKHANQALEVSKQTGNCVVGSEESRLNMLQTG